MLDHDLFDGASVTLQKAVAQELSNSSYDALEPSIAKEQAFLSIGHRIQSGETHLFDSSNPQDEIILLFLFDQNTQSAPAA